MPKVVITKRIVNPTVGMAFTGLKQEHKLNVYTAPGTLAIPALRGDADGKGVIRATVLLPESNRPKADTTIPVFVLNDGKTVRGAIFISKSGQISVAPNDGTFSGACGFPTIKVSF